MGLIEADKLIDKYQREDTIDVFRYEVLDDLISAPIVDAVPVRHGKWWRVPLEVGDQNHHYVFMSYRCSECKHAFDQKTPYCPWCGAKMDKKRKEE